MVFVPYSHFVPAENTSVSSQAIALRGSVVNPPDVVLSHAARCRLHGLCDHSRSFLLNAVFGARSRLGSGRDSSGAGDVGLLAADLPDCASNGGEAGV